MRTTRDLRGSSEVVIIGGDSLAQVSGKRAGETGRANRFVMFDTHAHVHDQRFDADRPAMLRRAHEAGVGTILTVGCDLSDSRRAIDIAHELGIYASVGIHPHEAKTAPPDLEGAFTELLENDGVLAIGETGLDYHYDHSPREAQQRVFRRQLALARKHGMPLIFHQREAEPDFLAILREEWQPQMRGVIHCFSGDTAMAATYTQEFGLKLGIGGVLTFKTADAIREAVASVGLDHLILETDCPYLAPIPHRGKRNEPAYIGLVAEKLATLLGHDLAEVVRRTSATARALFRI